MPIKLEDIIPELIGFALKRELRKNPDDKVHLDGDAPYDIRVIRAFEEYDGFLLYSGNRSGERELLLAHDGTSTDGKPALSIHSPPEEGESLVINVRGKKYGVNLYNDPAFRNFIGNVGEEVRQVASVPTLFD